MTPHGVIIVDCSDVFILYVKKSEDSRDGFFSDH